MRQTVLFILGILLLAGFCLASYFYISFGYGGLNGFLAEMKQPPDEEKIKKLRLEAMVQISRAQVELGTLSGLMFHEKTYADMCAKGEHGWKRSDSFAYACAYRSTFYYGTNRDYSELLLDMEQKLADSGWDREGITPAQPTIAQALEKATGELYLVELPDYQKPVVQNIIPAYMTLSINSFHGYGVPWTKSDDEPSPFGFGLAIGQDYYTDSSNGAPDAIAKRIIQSGQQPVMFAISREYFSN